MKFEVEANLTRETGSSVPAWWGRRITIPAIAVVATVGIIIALVVSVLVLSLRLNSAADAGPQAPPSATFLLTDTTTQGSWKGVFGTSGYAIAHDGHKFPSLAQIGIPDNGHTSLWIDNIDEARALQKSTGTKRIASTWYSWTPFTIDINLAGPNAHRLAIYVVDWDSDARVETIEILDRNSQEVLDTRQIFNFNHGQYIVWRVTGHIILRVTPVAGANAVISGLFLD